MTRCRHVLLRRSFPTRLSASVITLWVAWTCWAHAEVWVTGRHQLTLRATSVEGLTAELLEADVTPGFSLDQQANLRAFGQAAAGWEIDADFDSGLPVDERFTFLAERQGERVEAGRVVVEGGSDSLAWQRHVLGVQAERETGWGEIEATAGSPGGIPIGFRFRGEGVKGPYSLGETPAVESSLVLERDGELLSEGLDYIFDPDFAEVTFFEPLPVTSEVTGEYEVLSESGRRSYGMRGEWRDGPWRIGFSGAREARPDDDVPGAAVTPAESEYPDALTTAGWSVAWGADREDDSLDAPWMWGLSRVGTATRLGAEADRAAGWHAFGRVGPNATPWRLETSVTRIEPGYHPVGRPEDDGRVDVRGEVAYVGRGFRSTTTLTHETPLVRELSAPLHRWTLSEEYDRDAFSLGVNGGAVVYDDGAGRHGGFELALSPNPWELGLRWQGEESQGFVTEDSVPLSRTEVEAERPVGAGSLHGLWVQERVPLSAMRSERRDTARLTWRTPPAEMASWQGTLLVTRRIFPEGSGGQAFASVRRRVARGGFLPTLGWSAEWNQTYRDEAGTEADGLFTWSLDQSIPAGSWRVEAGVARLQTSSFAWVGRGGWSRRGENQRRVDAVVFAPAGGSVKVRGRFETSRQVNPAIAVNGAVTYGHLEALPTAQTLAEAAQEEAAEVPPDVGQVVEADIGWSRALWHASGGVRHRSRREGVGFDRPDEEVEVSAELGWGESMSAEARLKWSGIQGYSSDLGVRNKTEWSASVSWWWTESSIALFSFTRFDVVGGVPGEGGAGGVAKLQVETFF